MTKKKLTLLGTDVEELRNIVSDVVEETFQQQEDKKRKQEHINKTMKRDEMLKKTNVEQKGHEHTCPTCKSNVKKVANGFEICTDCGATVATIEKGQKLLICNTCGGVIPESFANTSNPCPHCGGSGAHWAK